MIESKLEGKEKGIKSKKVLCVKQSPDNTFPKYTSKQHLRRHFTNKTQQQIHQLKQQKNNKRRHAEQITSSTS